MDRRTLDKHPRTMNRHTYRLQPYAGVQTRHTCPSCGRKRCFTLYIDESCQPLADNVGRCDHESSCGYHYSPSDYFRDHPDRHHSDNQRACIPTQPEHRIPKNPPPVKICTIPEQYVRRSIRPDMHSSLTSYLSTFLDPLVLEGIITEYRLGVTKDRSIIFFQIDRNGHCRTGKIMKYDPATGHRIKDENTPSRITWVHSILKARGILSEAWQLTQCLFGEHLLPEYPNKKVALVESEKTAVICAALMPSYVWLATGGKTQLGDKLKVLTGRDVIAFPDIDGYETWQTKLPMLPGLTVKVSDYLLRNATEEERQSHIDIADLLLRTASAQTPPIIPQNSTYPILEYFAPEHHKKLTELIEELDLIPVSIKKIP